MASALSWVEGYTLPDAPALSIINASSSKIQEPGSLQQLGASVLSGLTPQGTIQSGVALEFTGRALGFGANWVDYRNDYLTRLFARASLSIGTAAQSSTGASPSAGFAAPGVTLAAVGIRIVFYDGTDVLLNDYLIKKVNAISQTCGCIPMDDPAFAQCKSDIAAELGPPAPPVWNASGANIAAATSGAFASGTLSRAAWADSAVWATLTLGFGDSFQISVAGEYRRAAMTSQNIGAGALRVRYGGNVVRGSLEGEYASANPDDIENRKGRLLLGLDIKLTTGTWLNATVGGDYDFNGSPFGLLSLANLKYAFAGTPSIPGTNAH